MITKYAVEGKLWNCDHWLRMDAVAGTFDSMTEAEIYCIERMTSLNFETRVIPIVKEDQ